MATTSGASDPSSAPRLKLVFMGTPPFAAACLEALLATRHQVAAVVTRPDKPAGRGLSPRPSAVKELALARGIEVLCPASPKDPAFVERLRAIAPDLGVVVAYGRILPDAVLAAPRLGCINAHASLLPALRGAAPIERAILAGLDRTGVTIMRINERLDAGDVLIAADTPIAESTNAETLRARLAAIAAELLVGAVDALADGVAAFTPQDDAAATYAPPLRRDESRIAWTEPAGVVDRQIRAFAPRPGAFTFFGGKRLKVLAGKRGTAGGAASAAPGTVLAVEDDAVRVACGEGSYRVDVVQPEGKRSMSAGAWARGAGHVLGRRFDADG